MGKNNHRMAKSREAKLPIEIWNQLEERKTKKIRNKKRRVVHNLSELMEEKETKNLWNGESEEWKQMYSKI